MNGLQSLDIMSYPAAAKLQFGWFDLAWPNIFFWLAVIVTFIICTRARIPGWMESDAASRQAEGSK